MVHPCPFPVKREGGRGRKGVVFQNLSHMGLGVDELQSALHGLLLLSPSAVAPGSPFLYLYLVGTV